MTLLSKCTGYWKMDDASATQTDSAGSNDGTLTGTYTHSVTGKINNCVTFNGSSDYMNVASAACQVNHQSDFTVAMWIKDDDVTVRNECFYITAGTGIYGVIMSVGLTSSAFTIYSAKAGFVFLNAASAAILSSSTWHHLVFVHDGTNSTAYGFIDGVLRIKATIASGTSSNSTSSVDIGRNHSSYSWDGEIDEVYISNNACLTHGTTTVGDTATGEVAELYNSGTGLSYPFSAGGTDVDNSLNFGGGL